MLGKSCSSRCPNSFPGIEFLCPESPVQRFVFSDSSTAPALEQEEEEEEAGEEEDEEEEDGEL